MPEQAEGDADDVGRVRLENDGAAAAVQNHMRLLPSRSGGDGQDKNREPSPANLYQPPGGRASCAARPGHVIYRIWIHSRSVYVDRPALGVDLVVRFILVRFDRGDCTHRHVAWIRSAGPDRLARTPPPGCGRFRPGLIESPTGACRSPPAFAKKTSHLR